MVCSPTAYEIVLKSCPDQIKLRAGLAENANYYWALGNKFDKVTMREGATNASGELMFSTLPFQVGSFNENAGTFSLRIYDVNRLPVKLTFAGNEYTSVNITFKNIEDPSGYQHNIIQ